MSKRPVLVALTLVLPAACGGGGDEAARTTRTAKATRAPASGCSAAGTELKISAKDGAFDLGCLAAPSGRPFTITFDNKDKTVQHNVAIYEQDPAANPGAKGLFAGETFTGPAGRTYSVGALPKGTYFFRCDVHPTQMTGAFIVE